MLDSHVITRAITRMRIIVVRERRRKARSLDHSALTVAFCSVRLSRGRFAPFCCLAALESSSRKCNNTINNITRERDDNFDFNFVRAAL